MQNAMTIFQQILTMFLYMAAGFCLFRSKLVSKEGSVGFAHTLIYLVLPCAILQSFFTERTAEKAAALGASFLWGFLILLLSMAVSALLFRKRPIDNFGGAFSNAGFMGLPLITSILGQECVFYVAGLIAFLNILQWFYGQSVLSGKREKLSVQTILKNPLVIALLVGIAAFLTGLRPPQFVSRCVASISAMNGPAAMIILGFYLAQTNLRALFGKASAYAVSAVRLLLIPLLTMGVLAVVPGVSADIKLALLLAASAPIGANVAVYAQKLGKDYVYAVETVCLSTLFSLVTLPAIILLAEKVF